MGCIKSFAWLAATVVFFLCLELSCTQNYGDLRLLQGGRTNSSFSAGRLEIFINSTWGSVCADNFNMTDATVACRQLGYEGAVSTDTSFHTPYGRGRDGPVWLDEVNCSDNLLHILSCANDGVGEHDCDHFSDVSVVCIDQPRPASPQPMDIRLTGGRFQSEGRLEVYCGGRWTAVCDQLDFQQGEADAVCRELGYTEAVDFDADITVEDLQVPKWLGQLICGNETNSIASCGECSPDTDFSSDDDVPGCSAVTVRCAHTVPYGSLRLVQDTELVDTDTSHGRLEVFQNGLWGTVCSDSFSLMAAEISCKQLGFLRALSFQDSVDAGFDPGSDSDAQTDFQCTEDDKRLVQCARVMSSGECTHEQDVAIFCTNSHPVTPAPGTPPPDNRPKLPTSTLIGILVGCFLVLILFCVGLGVISAHFYFVPYSVKKERHNLYFVEREGSTEAETSLNRNLESDPDRLDGFGKILGDDFISRPRPQNKYVSLDTSHPTMTVDSPSDQQVAESSQGSVDSSVPQPIQSSVPQPVQSSYVQPGTNLPMGSDSPSTISRVSVHSLHVLPGSPQIKHPTTGSPAPSKGSLNSIATPGSFLTQSQIQSSPSSSQPNINSPIPTAIPIPPPLKRQMENDAKQAASDDEPPNGMTVQEKARIRRGLINSSHKSESDPVLVRKMQAYLPPSSEHGSVPCVEQESPLTTTVQTAGDSQESTPTRGIMKSPKSAAKFVRSMPHLDQDSKADSLAGDNTSFEGRACDPAQPSVATDDQHTHNSHHVSFLLD